MTTDNPLAGVWIAEDIDMVARGVTDGSWIDVTLGESVPDSMRLR